jgi:predicted transcriptional regulator
MKVRFNNAIEFTDIDSSVSSDGAVIKLDNVEMDMVKFFESGHSLYSIKKYILKNHHLNQTEYAKRFGFLINRLTKNNFIDLGKTT